MKTCLTCIWSHPKLFDGTCPVSGELTATFTAEQHPECWQDINDQILVEKLVEFDRTHPDIPGL